MLPKIKNKPNLYDGNILGRTLLAKSEINVNCNSIAIYKHLVNTKYSYFINGITKYLKKH